MCEEKKSQLTGLEKIADFIISQDIDSEKWKKQRTIRILSFFYGAVLMLVLGFLFYFGVIPVEGEENLFITPADVSFVGSFQLFSSGILLTFGTFYPKGDYERAQTVVKMCGAFCLGLVLAWVFFREYYILLLAGIIGFFFDLYTFLLNKTVFEKILKAK